MRLLTAFSRNMPSGAIPGILAEYEPFECFAHSDACETLLVKHKGTDLFHVAKCYRKAAAPPRRRAFSKTSATRPAPVREGIRKRETLCVVREYVEGTPFTGMWPSVGPTRGGPWATAVSLCDILAYLHGRTPR